ncbi:GNAT family N-acetyltransferase, partial [bacterium]|nr:GNAT family N-acetyltransferase [bacterium]
ETDQPLGYIRLNWWHGREIAWLRYAMGERRGEGLCSEALTALLERLFSESLHRIEGEVYACNEPSIRLLKQLGFMREGVKRQAHFDGEEYIDIYAYGLLRADFAQ